MIERLTRRNHWVRQYLAESNPGIIARGIIILTLRYAVMELSCR